MGARSVAGAMGPVLQAAKCRLALAHLAMAFAASTFGVMSVIGKLALNSGLDPLALLLYRDSIACPVLLLWTLCTGGGAWPASRHDVALFILVGLTGIFGNQLCYVLGLKLTSADLASIYQPVSPFLTAVFAVFPWRYERPSIAKAVGVIVGGSGVLLMVIPSSQSDTKLRSRAHDVVGNLLLFCCAACASVFFLLQKPLIGRYSAVMITSAAYTAAAVTMLATCLPLYASGKVDLRVGTLRDWGVILYSSLVCSTLSYQLMTWANQYLDATIINCYCMLQPVVTGLLAYGVLGEPLSWLDGVAVLLVLFGLVAVGAANSEGASVNNRNLVDNECSTAVLVAS